MSNASDELVNIGYCVTHGKRLTGRDFDFYDNVELVDHVIRKTKAVGMGAYLLRTSTVNKKVHLACALIKSVTYQQPLSWWMDYVPVDINLNNVLINYNIEFHDGSLPQGTPLPLTEKIGEIKPLGRYVPFVYEDHYLHFEKDMDVDIVYVTTKKDDQGYPLLTMKGAEALIYYAHYIEIQKEYFQKIADNNMFNEAKKLKERAFAEARVPVAVTDNQWDDMLNVLTSHNRKRFNIPNK
jgi:hypothetical protein